MPSATGLPSFRHMDITQARARTASSRALGIVGLTTVVLTFAGAFLSIARAVPEPDPGSPDSAVTEFLRSGNGTLDAFASYLIVLGMIGLLWFAAGLSGVLRREAPDQDWMALVVLAAGAAVAGTMLVGNWELADTTTDTGEAVAFFRSGSLEMVNSVVAMGSLALAAGVALLRSRIAPSWLAWWAIIAGAGLIAGRSVWTISLWWFPYILFWLWIIIVGVRMLTGRKV
jgi:hypothetical protein